MKIPFLPLRSRTSRVRTLASNLEKVEAQMAELRRVQNEQLETLETLIVTLDKQEEAQPEDVRFSRTTHSVLDSFGIDAPSFSYDSDDTVFVYTDFGDVIPAERVWTNTEGLIRFSSNGGSRINLFGSRRAVYAPPSRVYVRETASGRARRASRSSHRVRLKRRRP